MSRRVVPMGLTRDRLRTGSVSAIVIIAPDNCARGRFRDARGDSVRIVDTLVGTLCMPVRPSVIAKRATAEIARVGRFAWRASLTGLVEAIHGAVTWAPSRQRYRDEARGLTGPVLYAFAGGRVVAMVAPVVVGGLRGAP